MVTCKGANCTKEVTKKGHYLCYNCWKKQEIHDSICFKFKIAPNNVVYNDKKTIIRDKSRSYFLTLTTFIFHIFCSS